MAAIVYLYHALQQRPVASVVASRLGRLSPDQETWVQALAGDIVLCSWARHFTSTESVSTRMSEWVPPNCWDNLKEFCDGQVSHPLASAGVHEYWLYV